MNFISLDPNSLLNISDSNLSILLIYFALHVSFAVLLLPCSQMTMLAGIFWGPVFGLLASISGLLLSALSTLLIARKFGNAFIKIVPRKMRFYVLRTKRNKMICRPIPFFFITGNPIIPSASIGYLYGLTNIGIPRFILYLSLSVLPLQICFVSLGYSISDFAKNGDLFMPILALTGTVAGVFIMKKIRNGLQ